MHTKIMAAATAFSIICASGAIAQTTMQNSPGTMSGQTNNGVASSETPGHGSTPNNGAMGSSKDSRSKSGSTSAAGNSASMSGEKGTVTNGMMGNSMNTRPTSGSSSAAGNSMPTSGEKGTMSTGTGPGMTNGGSMSKTGN